MKIVYALPGDKVFFSNSKLFINDKELKNSQNISYVFHQNEIKLIELYLDNKILKSNAYLIFWDNTLNSNDSRRFGAIGKNDFIGIIKKF